MDILETVQLTCLMQATTGEPSVTVALLDGPVATGHVAFQGRHIRAIAGDSGAACERASIACHHGTFVAGMLAAVRGSSAPAICPDCTLLVRPVFAETTSASMPSATAQELAAAIVESVEAGARILNMSLSLSRCPVATERELWHSLDYAAARGVLAIAASGNDAALGASPITRHRWVIPVAGSDSQGRPSAGSNLGRSIGTRGLRAPGEDVTSLRADGSSVRLSGTSVAVPFVTGTAALLWSLFPEATATQVKRALLDPYGRRRPAIVPPLLDAAASHRALRAQL